MPNKATFIGLKNCDTCKKASKWLVDNDIAFNVIDVRADGLDESLIKTMLSDSSIDVLVNKRSTTWRQLGKEVQASINADNVVTLLSENPTLLKRPVLRTKNEQLVGFKPDIYAEHLL